MEQEKEKELKLEQETKLDMELETKLEMQLETEQEEKLSSAGSGRHLTLAMLDSCSTLVMKSNLPRIRLIVCVLFDILAKASALAAVAFRRWR